MKTAIPADETIQEGQTAVVYSKSATIGKIVDICRSWMFEGSKAVVGKPIAKGRVTEKLDETVHENLWRVKVISVGTADQREAK